MKVNGNLISNLFATPGCFNLRDMEQLLAAVLTWTAVLTSWHEGCSVTNGLISKLW